MARRQVQWWDLMGPTPRQVEFLLASLKFRYLLFAGSRGPGKSRTLRWGLVWRLLEWWKQGLRDVRVMLATMDYPTLRDRQISKIRTEFPLWLGEIKNTQADGLCFFVRPQYGGGIIALRNLDEPGKYIGGEYAGIAIDELTENDKDTFDILRGSMRWPGVNNTFFWGATNPLGRGVLWVRSMWVENDFSQWPEIEFLKSEFKYIPALPTDNPHLTPEYWAELRSQPPHIQKAWIEGDWYSMPGAAFEEWRQNLHITSSSFHPPASWTFFGGMDWGYRKPGCFLLFAVGPEEVIVVDELYFSKLYGEQAGEAVGELLRGWPRCQYIACDPQMWFKTGQSGLTIGEEVQVGLAKAFGFNETQTGVDYMPKLLQEEKGAGYRAAKKQAVHKLLAWKEYPDPDNPNRKKVPPWGMPKLRVHPRCKNLIRTLPALPYDKNKEDVDTDTEDHAYDALAAFAMSRPVFSDRPEPPEPHSQDRHPGFTRGADDPTLYRRRQKTYRGHVEDDESDVRRWRVPTTLEEVEDEW